MNDARRSKSASVDFFDQSTRCNYGLAALLLLSSSFATTRAPIAMPRAVAAVMPMMISSVSR